MYNTHILLWDLTYGHTMPSLIDQCPLFQAVDSYVPVRRSSKNKNKDVHWQLTFRSQHGTLNLSAALFAKRLKMYLFTT